MAEMRLKKCEFYIELFDVRLRYLLWSLWLDSTG